MADRVAFELRSLDDMQDVSPHTATLQTILRHRSALPWMMFLYGPPGVGKTTTANLFVRQWFGTDRDAYDKSVNHIHVAVFPGPETKLVARVVNKLMQPLPTGATSCTRFVILDEVDSLSADTWNGLAFALKNFHSAHPGAFRACIIALGNSQGLVTDEFCKLGLKLQYERVDQRTMRSIVERGLQTLGKTDVPVQHIMSLVQRADGDIRGVIQTIKIMQVTRMDLQDVPLTQMSFVSMVRELMSLVLNDSGDSTPLEVETPWSAVRDHVARLMERGMNLRGLEHSIEVLLDEQASTATKAGMHLKNLYDTILTTRTAGNEPKVYILGVLTHTYIAVRGKHNVRKPSLISIGS